MHVPRYRRRPLQPRMGRRRLHALQGPQSVAPRPQLCTICCPVRLSGTLSCCTMVHVKRHESTLLLDTLCGQCRKLVVCVFMRFCDPSGRHKLRRGSLCITIFANSQKRHARARSTAQMRMPCELMREQVVDASPVFGEVRGLSFQPEQSEAPSAASRALCTEEVCRAAKPTTTTHAS